MPGTEYRRQRLLAGRVERSASRRTGASPSRGSRRAHTGAGSTRTASQLTQGVQTDRVHTPDADASAACRPALKHRLGQACGMQAQSEQQRTASPSAAAAAAAGAAACCRRSCCCCTVHRQRVSRHVLVQAPTRKVGCKVV